MQASASELFLLADHCLGKRVARRVRVAGNQITTIEEEWPGRDLNSNAPQDEEIIRHLGEKAGSRALWITQDWDAYGRHREALYSSQISVLWLRWPKYSNMSVEPKSRILQLVIETVYDLVVASDTPVYFRVTLNSDDACQPILERLLGSLRDRPPRWQGIPLT